MQYLGPMNLKLQVHFSPEVQVYLFCSFKLSGLGNLQLSTDSISDAGTGCLPGLTAQWAEDCKRLRPVFNRSCSPLESCPDSWKNPFCLRGARESKLGTLTIKPGNSNGLHEHRKQNGSACRKGVQQSEDINPSLGHREKGLTLAVNSPQLHLHLPNPTHPYSHLLRVLFPNMRVRAKVQLSVSAS